MAAVIPEGFVVEKDPRNALPEGFVLEDKAITQLEDKGEQYLMGELESPPLDLREMSRNAPQSAIDVVADVLMPVMRPDEFIKGTGTIMKGAFEKMMAEQMESIRTLAGAEDIEIPTETWDALWAPYKEKYKDFDSLKRATEKDPFGVARDIIGVLGSAGMTANAARKTGASILPEKLPIKLYESSAKFSTTIPDLERAKMVKALLKEDIPLTADGVRKVNKIIDETNAELDRFIATADQAGKSVTKTAVLRDIGRLRKDLSNKIDSVRDRKILNGIVDRYLLEVKGSNKNSFTISELQEFKKDVYAKVTDWSKEKGNKRKTKDKVYRAIGETTKELIEEQVPEARALNTRQAPLLGIKKDLRRVAQRIENNNLVSLRDPLQTGASTVIAEYLLGMPGLGAAFGVTVSVLQKPAVKSKLARQLYKLKQDNPSMSTRAMLETGILVLPAIISEMEAEEAQKQTEQAQQRERSSLEAEAMP